MNGPLAQIFEVQHPTQGRKSSPADPRPLDPPPIVKLLFAPGRHDIHYTRLFCHADLFRMPDRMYPGEFTYFYDTDDRDSNGLPIYALKHTPHAYAAGLSVYESIGDHLLTTASVESHLLVRRDPVPAHLLPDTHEIVFIFAGLSVQQVGRYVLRYTVYEENNIKVATCLGRPFVVTPAGQSSALRPSTHLTNSLAPLHIPALRRRG